MGGVDRVDAVRRKRKTAAEVVISAATLPSYWLRRFSYSVTPRKEALHLGSGPKYLQGFLNIDANPVFEHFYPDELKALLRECLRLLKPSRFSNFVFCDGQHRTAFDLGHMEEILLKAGFRRVEEAREGSSRLYGEEVPLLNPETRRNYRILSTWKLLKTKATDEVSRAR